MTALNDPRVTPHGEGFDVRTSLGNFHVGLNRRLLWSVSDVHTGEPAACTALASFEAACGSYETAGRAAAAVLDCDSAEATR